MTEWTEHEPERYELWEGPFHHFQVDRRGFLQLLSGVVVLVVSPSAEAQESGRPGAAAPPASDLAAWLHVAEDGMVTVFTGKAEVGQDIRTSLTQAVAEELRAPLASIRLVMGDTDLTPFDMGTFGSRTTPTMSPQLRRAAAAARELLKQKAAAEWGVAVATLTVEDGNVVHPPSRRRRSFGSLSRGEKLVRVLAAEAELAPAERWTVAGHALAKVNGREVVTGSHRYTSDLAPPGMWHGKVLRPPALGATLASLDATAAEALPNVVVVRDGDFAGVAAPRAPLAARALEALKPTWTTTPQPPGRELYERLRKGAPSATPRAGRRGAAPQVVGSVETAMASAHRRHQATYQNAYIAHVPLEPRAAVAEWQAGRLTVWTGSQRPFGVRDELAEAFHLPEDKVRVIVPDTGSAYGGKHTGECALEAARLAKAAGRPVKLVWTREEEFRWAYFRPAGVIDIRSGADAAGRLTAWEMHDYNAGSAGIRTPYEVPNQHIEYHAADSPLRQGSYRALAATANNFARESHLDELAEIVGLDPLEFRRRNLKDARLRAVLDAAAERFGWGQAKAAVPGQGRGLACGTEKGGFVATCAEVRVGARGEVKVLRLVAAFECGAIVNPDHLRNQVEGALIMGLGGALFESIEFDEGQVLNPRLSLYRVPRFSDVPEVEVVLLDRKDLPSVGAGECPIIAVAPAVANALYSATGTRSRALPLGRSTASQSAPQSLPK